mgnify:CR=1 FL=1
MLSGKLDTTAEYKDGVVIVKYKPPRLSFCNEPLSGGYSIAHIKAVWPVDSSRYCFVSLKLFTVTSKRGSGRSDLELGLIVQVMIQGFLMELVQELILGRQLHKLLE